MARPTFPPTPFLRTTTLLISLQCPCHGSYILGRVVQDQAAASSPLWGHCCGVESSWLKIESCVLVLTFYESALSRPQFLLHQPVADGPGDLHRRSWAINVFDLSWPEELLDLSERLAVSRLEKDQGGLVRPDCTSGGKIRITSPTREYNNFRSVIRKDTDDTCASYCCYGVIGQDYTTGGQPAD